MEFITTEIKENILIVTLDRPTKLNALNRTVIGELDEVIKQSRLNDEVKAIIITGKGDKAFAAGADISEFQHYPAAEAKLMARRGHEVFHRIEQFPKVIVAAVNGFCLGGGCELAMATHFRVCSPNAKFGQPEVNLGLIPGYGGTQRLPRLIGRGRATELLLTGDMIGAEEAQQLGLVNHVFSQETLIEETIAILTKITKKAPLAVAEIIHNVNGHYANDIDGYQEEAASFGNLFETDDFKEGVDAFINKRTPQFQGK